VVTFCAPIRGTRGAIAPIARIVATNKKANRLRRLFILLSPGQEFEPLTVINPTVKINVA
jgi:hypothetical protein